VNYDPAAAERIRRLLSGRTDVAEKKMVGGLSFLISGNMCCGNIEEETRWTLEAVRRILQIDGADLEDVVKVTVYLADARNFGRYNKIFGEYFPDGRVSRTTIEARAVIECKIEMDAVAYKPRS